MKSYSEFIQSVHRVMEGKWGGMDNVARPQGNIPTNNIDRRYREAGEDDGLIYGPSRKPVQNKKEFVEQIADKFDLEYSQVYGVIRRLGEPVDFDVLYDELRKLQRGD